MKNDGFLFAVCKFFDLPKSQKTETEIEVEDVKSEDYKINIKKMNFNGQIFYSNGAYIVDDNEGIIFKERKDNEIDDSNKFNFAEYNKMFKSKAIRPKKNKKFGKNKKRK